MRFVSEMSLNVCEQTSLLLEFGVDATGIKHSLSDLAEITGISYQALANLVQGKTSNPRLKTLLALCQCYGISLDYYNCETANACREYLYLRQVRAVSPLISEIDNESTLLSPKGQRNVLAIMEWMRFATHTAR